MGGGGEETHTCSRHSERPYMKQTRAQEAENSGLFWRSGDFKASEESASPSLGLVSLKEWLVAPKVLCDIVLIQP